MRKAALTRARQLAEEAANLDYTAILWCIDLTEGLTGEVGLIEMAVDQKKGINIKPGYLTNAVFNVDEDGKAYPFRTLNVADAVLNWALLPAIQKWRPTYRYGTISNVDSDNDTCDLTLDDVYSEAQSIFVNPQVYFSGVSIQYMACNGYAFQNGDKVVVKFPGFSSTAAPVVIGFKDNPKPCYARYIRVSTNYGVLIYDIVGRRKAHDITGVPDFPCAYDATVNAWLAAHVVELTENTDWWKEATLAGSVGTESYDPNREINCDTYHMDILGSYEAQTINDGLPFPGYATSYDEYSWPSPFISTVPSHTGDTIDNTYNAYYANVAYECTHIDYGSWEMSRDIIEVWDAVRDSFVPFIIKNCSDALCLMRGSSRSVPCLVW